jgi:hypothetical protein
MGRHIRGISAIACATALALVVTHASAATNAAYDGPLAAFVQQYSSDLNAFQSTYNGKVVHLSDVTVKSTQLPDKNAGTPWTIVLSDEHKSALNIACFVASNLSTIDHQRALGARKGAKINLVAVVQADGFSIGLTDCKVAPTASVAHAAPSSTVAEAAVSPHSTPVSPVAITVTNAWNDMVNGALFVHAAVRIDGAAQDANLAPTQFALTMRLANGAKKVYAAMSRSAPTFQKLNPLNVNTTTTAYEVDPKEDLGSIGSIIVPAHGTVHIVVTFEVDDTIADPNDNRQIILQ